jgi:hypothetical protein
MKQGGTVQIKGDIDAIEPLRLAIGARLPGSLKLEILQTTLDLSLPVVIFSGTVLKPSLAGRQITANCQEWGSLMMAMIPTFYIQRICNYRVFEANTCKLSRAAFEIAITVEAISGRNVTIKGAGLIAKPQNWFNGGWIEIGTGLTRKVLYVISSTQASGDEIGLICSQLINIETPVGATIVPGCDGARSTCILKYNNLVNFGGHATPRDNLSLVAIKTDATAGKK